MHYLLVCEVFLWINFEEWRSGGRVNSMEGENAAGAAPQLEVDKVMNVLVAIDDSEESFHALRWAVDKILKRRSTAEEDSSSTMVVTVVHVVEPLPRYAFPGGHVVESASKSQEQNAARVLSRAFDMCREGSVRVKTLILEGDPKDRICRAVEEMDINLLVVGSRGLGQIKRAFLGSVSDYCAHHARCPVLVVKQPPKKT